MTLYTMPCSSLSQRGVWGRVSVAVVCWTAAIAGCQRTVAPPASEAAPPAQAASAQGVDPAYVRWLEERSMLYQARRQAARVSGNGVQWRHPYGTPQPRQAVQRASVWLLDYGGSGIPPPGPPV